MSTFAMKILLSGLQYHLGIHDPALDWSYRLNRPQHVCIGNAISKRLLFLTILCPQGSVLGPQWFAVYTFPVRDIILKYNLNYHMSTLMTRSFTLLFKSSQEPADSCTITLEKEIRNWMRQNFLKLNNEKTEFLLVGSHQQLLNVSLQFITIVDSQITPSSQARNLVACVCQITARQRECSPLRSPVESNISSSAHTKHSSSCCNFVQKVMPYHPQS